MSGGIGNITCTLNAGVASQQWPPILTSTYIQCIAPSIAHCNEKAIYVHGLVIFEEFCKPNHLVGEGGLGKVKTFFE